MFLQDEADQSTVSSMLEGRSLFVFSPTNPIRIFLARIVWHHRFEQFIITLIVLSSAVLAIDAPSLDPDGRLKAILVRSSHLTAPMSWCSAEQQQQRFLVALSSFRVGTVCSTWRILHQLSISPLSASDGMQSVIDFWFGIIFTAEAAAKIVVYGLALGKGAYIKSPWNVLDFMTVVVGNLLILLGEASGNFSSLKSLRTLRALRPIRMASRWPGMKVSCFYVRIYSVTSDLAHGMC